MIKLFNRFKPHYQIIENPNLESLKKKYNNVWKDPEIPGRQLKTTEKQLPQIEKIPAIADLIQMIKLTKIKGPKILEIGCSTGYHEEAFRRAKLTATYEGCDYSEVFITMAGKLHPKSKFTVGDATKLSYANNQFAIVISGCCILHIIDYQKAITEAIRVSKKYVIFHRTPTIHTHRTTFAKKTAYGREMVEIFFNETELSELFIANDLTILAVKTHAQLEIPGLGEPVFMKNYLCIKSQN